MTAHLAKVVTVDWVKKQAVVSLDTAPSVRYDALLAKSLWTKDLRSKSTAVNDGPHGGHIDNQNVGHPGHNEHDFGEDDPKMHHGRHDHGTHTHRLGDDLKAGDRVVVVFVEGSSTPVVIAQL